MKRFYGYTRIMEIENAADILAKIGNPTRLQVVRLLVRAGEPGLPVGAIQKQLDIPASTLTHHLSHLKSVGLVHQSRQQTSLICTLDFEILQTLIDFLSEECCIDVKQLEAAS